MVRTAEMIYRGSDPTETRAYYRALEAKTPEGPVAMNLFRAQKCSTRAKHYYGNGYKTAAYARKEYSIGELTAQLTIVGKQIGIVWGWKIDPEQRFAPWVLYVDLPEIGQVSFHAIKRGDGPDYQGEWDRQHLSETRILSYCNRVMGTQAPDPGDIRTKCVKHGLYPQWVVEVRGRMLLGKFPSESDAINAALEELGRMQ